MIRNKSRFVRKLHRYLGLFVGIQFLAWTLSGLYFSWNNIDDVHGDHLRKNSHAIPANTHLVSPDSAVRHLKLKAVVDSLQSIRLISLVGKPVYQLVYFSGHVGEGIHHHTHQALADATTGHLRGPLTRDEAIAVAKDNVTASVISEVTLVESTNGHHEYRESPLPAYANFI
jgi:hypothetical protein